MSEPRLPGMEPARELRICPECHTRHSAFHYGSKVPPWWYMVAHQHPGDAERVGFGYCAGGGYPALDQAPAAAATTEENR